MKTLLALDIPDTLDSCAMMVRDMSVYSDTLPYECATLQVTYPGFLKAVSYPDLQKNFNLVVTSCNMGVQRDNCDNPSALTDGVYVVKWSLAPNDKLFVEYNHLRIANALNLVRKVLCCLDLGGCLPEAMKQDTLRKLMVFEGMIRAAKAMVEVNHNPKKGMEVYNYARKNILSLSKSCGCR